MCVEVDSARFVLFAFIILVILGSDGIVYRSFLTLRTQLTHLLTHSLTLCLTMYILTLATVYVYVMCYALYINMQLQSSRNTYMYMGTSLHLHVLYCTILYCTVL
jgi:hypothetical protein